MAKIDHVAIRTTSYEDTKAFFQEVFEMTVERELGDSPDRRLWLAEGVQINEVPTCENAENAYDHFAILVEDTATVMERVSQYGCKILKDRWFALPNGTVIELIPAGQEFSL